MNDANDEEQEARGIQCTDGRPDVHFDGLSHPVRQHAAITTASTSTFLTKHLLVTLAAANRTTQGCEYKCSSHLTIRKDGDMIRARKKNEKV
ncbi:hypothetical protein E2C01_037256 [Portunus trituberculatus]|uniref:Uncharacterized protein n=1 Tax=Portunus trituberculatus TaxID=210409 RepID=A0A5B7FE66_PORTR|nr:hypothetical protein [Portunus trituberculatus]